MLQYFIDISIEAYCNQSYIGILQKEIEYVVVKRHTFSFVIFENTVAKSVDG